MIAPLQEALTDDQLVATGVRLIQYEQRNTVERKGSNTGLQKGNDHSRLMLQPARKAHTCQDTVSYAKAVAIER